MIHGRYSDGIRSTTHDVEVTRLESGIKITFPISGNTLIWSFPETRIEREIGEARLHRVREGVDAGERLSVNLTVFEAMFAGDLARLGKGRAGEAGPGRIALWTGLAIASMAVLFFVGLPFLARIIAPLVPYSWEVSLGKSVEPQVLEMVGQGKPAKLCGKPDGPGKTALNAMASRLVANTKLPGELKIDIVDLPVINAFALPGGRIFLFRPILEKATNPDEVAGVLAHEIGHVIHRDSMRALIHDSALSIIVGIVIGDVTGGGLIGGLGKMALGSAYSRENERDADKVSVDLMGQAGADPRAINIFFRRLTELEKGGGSGGLLAALNSHPITGERIAAVDAMSDKSPPPRAPILNSAEWAALKSICAEGQ